MFLNKNLTIQSDTLQPRLLLLFSTKSPTLPTSTSRLPLYWKISILKSLRTLWSVTTPHAALQLARSRLKGSEWEQSIWECPSCRCTLAERWWEPSRSRSSDAALPYSSRNSLRLTEILPSMMNNFSPLSKIKKNLKFKVRSSSYLPYFLQAYMFSSARMG